MVPKKIVLISDPKVLSIPINETKDPVINLLKDFPEIKCDTSEENRKQVTKYFSFIRKSVAERLLLAQENLPNGIYLKVKEALRPINFQTKIFKKYLEHLKTKHPNLKKEELISLASKFISPPFIAPPHTTGAAVDITLVNKNGQELNLGNFPSNTSQQYDDSALTLVRTILNVQKKNRKILIDAMSKAGFVNYPTEWWHWSYGDRYWAYHKKFPFALFGPVRLRQH